VNAELDCARPVPIEQDPRRFEVACWRAFYARGTSSFDAAL